MLAKNHNSLTRLILLHFDVVDIHNFDVMTPLPLHFLLFGTPNINRFRMHNAFMDLNAAALSLAPKIAFW
jgi:hypothetical protein